MPCSNVSAHCRRNRLEDDKRHKEERDGFVEIIRLGTDVSGEAYGCWLTRPGERDIAGAYLEFQHCQRFHDRDR